jgi:serine/threonine-protein kinase
MLWAMTDLEPGSRLGRYRIEAVVGRGGMGVVYRALQEGLERHVALKVIAAHLAEDPDFRARFVREAKLAASLDHPNVVPVFEAGEQDSALFLAMRFVRGEDLATIVKRDGPLRPAAASAIVTQVAAALDAAHDLGLVHRDVKPHNILLAGNHAYLTDFGLTKSTESVTAITRTGTVLGSIDYAAPEQLLGDPTDRRSDVYSLACTMFHLIAGAPPFERPSDTARMLAHLNDPPPDLPAAPPPLSGAIKQGMAKAPEDRYATAGDFARACAAAVAQAAAAATRQRPSMAGDLPAVAAQPTVARPSPATGPVGGSSPAAGSTPAASPPPASGSTPAAGVSPGASPPLSAGSSAPIGPSSFAGPSPARAGGRRRGLVAGGVILVLALGAVAALVLSGGSDSKDKAKGGGATSSPAATAVAVTIPSGNLTANPSFEADQKSWDVSGSQISRLRAVDAPDGDYAIRVAQSGPAGEYAIDDSPDSVDQSVAGRTYVASAWVKATAGTDGDRVCIGIRERTPAGKPIGDAYVGMPMSAAEYREVRVAYAAQADGNRVDVHVFGDSPDANPDDAFLADVITLTEGSGPTTDGEC